MRTAVVTGGTRRIGKAIADRLREDGWRVLTSSHRPETGADIIADLSSPLGAARLYAEALKLNGGEPPEALVNNAALFTGDTAVMRAINLESPKKLIMLMAGRERGIGVAVNILDAREREGAYGDTKRELAAYTRRAAAMFADTLRVNAVSPGPVIAPADVHESAGETPFGRPSPTAVADAVAFLLSAKFTSGCIIPVDGGQSIVL